MYLECVLDTRLSPHFLDLSFGVQYRSMRKVGPKFGSGFSFVSGTAKLFKMKCCQYMLTLQVDPPYLHKRFYPLYYLSKCLLDFFALVFPFLR